MDERRGRAVWAAALTLVGTRFRGHGRAPGTGLDCVGLVIAAHRLAGAAVAEPGTYRIGDVDEAWVAETLRAAGLAEVAAPAPGDVVVRTFRARAVHLGIWGGASVVEAHAGLRRVVETPACGWDGQLRAWRMEELGWRR